MNLYLETIIFFYVIKNPKLVELFKANYFQSKHLQVLFDIVKDFVIQYRTEPSLNQVIELAEVQGKLDLISKDAIAILWKNREKVDSYQADWLYGNSVAYAQWQNLVNGLKSVLAYVKTVSDDVTFENCQEIVEKAKGIFQHETNFTVSEETGHDFFDPETHFISKEDMVTSGYKFIDMCLGGGFSKKTLTCFMGAYKAGKSMWLANLAANAVKNGLNVVYVTLEMPYAQVARRIGSNIFSINPYDYTKIAEDPVAMSEIIKKWNKSNFLVKHGKLIIQEYPSATATANDIESFILKKEEEFSTLDHPFKFDIVLFDYINIMKDQKHPSTENTYIKIKTIAEDMRAIMQRNNWVGVTVTQVNAEGLENADLTMNNISESRGLIATVDALFGIIRTQDMRLNHTYWLKALAIRGTDYNDYKKEFRFDTDHLRIIETDKDAINEQEESANRIKKDSSIYQENTKNLLKTISQPEIGIEQPDLLGAEIKITGQDIFK